MDNIFQNKDNNRKHSTFTWEGLGNIKEGRGNLGEDMPVIVYRLLEYTMLHVLAEEYGEEKANDLFRRAGFLAGSQLAKNTLDLDVDFDGFVEQLQKTMRELKIAVLRIESFDEATGELFLTAAEDLDCSGLPATGEMVCQYDEGFISGLLQAYTGKKYNVREVDCWANGDRVCRFHGQIQAVPVKPVEDVQSDAAPETVQMAASYQEPAPVAEPMAASYQEPAPVAEPMAASHQEPAPVAEPMAASYQEPAPVAEPMAASYQEPAPVAEPTGVFATAAEPVEATPQESEATETTRRIGRRRPRRMIK